MRADQIGTARLDEACDTFQDEWTYGSDKTKELIDEIKEGVSSNKKGYEAGRTGVHAEQAPQHRGRILQ